MDDRRSVRGWVLSGLAGIALWSVVAILGGRSEPWDSPLYWSTGYPLSLLMGAGFGALFPQRPWRWAAALTFAQLPVMLVAGSGLGLLPLGLVLLAVLALPVTVAAWIGAGLRRWLTA